MRATSRGVPLKDRRSASKISTPLNPAAAMASSFSASPPLSDTVAMEVCMVMPSIPVTALSSPDLSSDLIRGLSRRSRLLSLTDWEGRDKPGPDKENARAVHIVASMSARSSGVTSVSMPNHAFQAGRAWCSSMPRPLTVRLPRARAAARSGVSRGM